MKKLILVLFALVVSTVIYGAPATPPPSQDDINNYDQNSTVFRENTEWAHTWITNVKKENMPSVLLIGDSITMQYQKSVSKELKGKSFVGYMTTSLSVADPAYTPLLSYALLLKKYTVIHFNNGLHGVPYSDEQYEAYYRKAIKLMKKLQPNAKIILVTSTPLLSGKDDNFQKKIVRRNNIVKKIAEEESLQVDDLYSIMKDKDEMHKDKYHFKSTGVNLLASQVVKELKSALGKE